MLMLSVVCLISIEYLLRESMKTSPFHKTEETLLDKHLQLSELLIN